MAEKNLDAKVAVGKAAAKFARDGMIVGLGTGTTARYLIDALSERRKQGLAIQGVATSRASHERAEAGGIPMLDIDDVEKIDIDFDGADEIDPKKQMIKGGGGALLREKMVAQIADEMVVVVDETKKVGKLGKFGLPVEVIPFGHFHVERQLQKLGYTPKLRRNAQMDPYTTDNGHYILDLQADTPFDDPHYHHLQIRSIPGVIETGFFLDMAGRVLIGHVDGSVTVWE